MLKAIDYVLDELRFAYSYHVYLRWQTHCNRPSNELPHLDAKTLANLVEHHAIHVLECEAGPREIRTMVSLQPSDAVAASEGRIKGQAAKWLRERSGERFSRGYFACTSGRSTAEQIAEYLASQGEHHGYAAQVRPPLYVETFQVNPDDETRLQSPHASTRLRFHVVLATWRRQGVFGAQAGAAIARCWRDLETKHKFALIKVSFVPDHVHLALNVHPVVALGPLVVELMNAAQRVIWRDFADDATQCHRLARWSVTLAAKKRDAKSFPSSSAASRPPAARRRRSRWTARQGLWGRLFLAASVRLHRASRWHLSKQPDVAEQKWV